MLSTKVTNVADNHYDRQWDARFNVQEDAYLDTIVSNIKRDWDSGKFAYILIGGPEVGTRPYQNDYQVRHIHVAAIFNNRVSKRSILTNWGITQGNGYYLVPRDRNLPYSGWRNHHLKEFSKVDKKTKSLFEMGTLPQDKNGGEQLKPSEEEKKRKVDEILVDMRTMIENNQEDEAFKKYPRNFLQYGEKIKALVTQKRDFFKSNGDPHIWLFGFPGTGKSAILSLIYPMYYKKNLHNKFFDLFDPKVHTHVMLEDLDHEAVERLSINFIKTICDECGFPIDQKYKTPQLVRTTVLVSSNFTIDQLVQDGPGWEQNLKAIHRRFYHVNIMEFLRAMGLKLIPKFDRNRLKQEGNEDPAKLFMNWDYLRDQPTGEAVREPEYYQQLVRKLYYSN